MRLVTLAAMKRLLMLAAVGLFVTGCASPNVNPPQARANTGYVDFHADPSAGLCWEVARFDGRSQSFNRVFSELDPPSGGVLRLAFAPGRHRLRITFLNRVIAKPAEVEVEVQDAKITPVRVTLIEAGTALVRTERENRGGTAKGRYGRRTTIRSDATAMYNLSAVADAPIPYQLKERTPYAP
jgi:hypothetical protein